MIRFFPARLTLSSSQPVSLPPWMGCAIKIKTQNPIPLSTLPTFPTDNPPHQVQRTNQRENLIGSLFTNGFYHFWFRSSQLVETVFEQRWSPREYFFGVHLSGCHSQMYSLQLQAGSSTHRYKYSASTGLRWKELSSPLSCKEISKCAIASVFPCLPEQFLPKSIRWGPAKQACKPGRMEREGKRDSLEWGVWVWVGRGGHPTRERMLWLWGNWLLQDDWANKEIWARSLTVRERSYKYGR